MTMTMTMTTDNDDLTRCMALISIFCTTHQYIMKLM
jgi:hypothetical protein